ncbi:MAG: 30S ribosomal protein S20 [Bdellovibrionales bacterium]|nr:30S ribosomal protein S20 [Bdellovibrionales bacterium]
MATHKSAIKRHRQSEQKETYNRWWKSRVRTTTKNFLQAVENKDKAEATTLLKTAIKEIDKAATKGIFPKTTASRKVARLSKKHASL